ncbi:MAG: hypothetical protein AAF805_02955 [Planctomycetota bacterium]
MAKVFLDITGFYFRGVAEVEPQATVADVLESVKQNPERHTASTGDPTYPGVKFDYTLRHGFVDALEVVFPPERPPVSRQRSLDPNKPVQKLEAGTYFFQDSPIGQNPLLAWQYYVSDENKLPQNGSAASKTEQRIITPSAETRFEWADHWTVVFRLVGIFTGPTFPKPVLPFDEGQERPSAKELNHV